ncbi:MAG TPA: lactate utilization protein [Pyrinomonadaceae bacterium]|nr:lactate utilization protein [Pyrinomonadaceae bacterium]
MINGDARAEIMRSIRAHLATSAPYDGLETQIKTNPSISVSEDAVTSVVQLFKQNLEAVDGHCIVVGNDTEVEEVFTRIAQGNLIAASSAPPATRDLFKYDVGITNAQAGIAETGTLVLDSAVERNRLVSLVPPVHIAIINASRIYATLGEALAVLQGGGEVSPAITFITGPSRTGDIEMTLTVGVHGPRELYVIVIEGPTQFVTEGLTRK